MASQTQRALFARRIKVWTFDKYIYLKTVYWEPVANKVELIRKKGTLVKIVLWPRALK